MGEYNQTVRTRNVARIVGPYLALTALALFAQHSNLLILVPAFMQHASLVLVTGAFTLMVGLTIIAAHHHWTSASAAVISLIGVIVALKGAVLIIAPAVGTGLATSVMHAPLLLLIVAYVLLLAGMWLSFVGWLSKA